MNIFVLDENPVKAAQLQCDKHVVKMIVESAQMLSTAHRILDGTMEMRPSKSGKRMVKYYKLSDDNKEDLFYKAVHHGHPCTVWTMESKQNYDWHYNHFLGLCDEYRYRYGRVHDTDKKLRYVLRVAPVNIPDCPMTKFKLAMQSNPECMFDDVVESYRAFYLTKRKRFSMRWSRRLVPDWFKSETLYE